MSPAIYAMVGAAAALTGVTRLTVTCVIVMFEVCVVAAGGGRFWG